MPYKISGTLSDDCNVKIFQGDDYIGYTTVSGGSHDTVFDLTVSGVVTTVAEKSDGEVVGFGNVSPESTGDSVNITVPAASGAAINSIQSGVFQIPADQVSGTEAISEVDPTKAVLIFLGSKSNNGNVSTDAASIELTNGTTITARRYTSSGGDVNVSYMVLEFTSGAAVQRGMIEIAGDTNTDTATITAVDLAKTVIIPGGQHCNTLNNFNYYATHLVLTNATTITATCHLTPVANHLPWQILEFD